MNYVGLVASCSVVAVDFGRLRFIAFLAHRRWTPKMSDSKLIEREAEPCKRDPHPVMRVNAL